MLVRIHAGPVLALARVEEDVFEESFLTCIRTFDPSLYMDKVAVFTYPGCYCI